MRFLILGAGALGGYFGGRLAEAGEDVTFLLRPRRAAQIAQTGLVIRSPAGELHLPSPQCVQADALTPEYDVVLLGCKAYDLDSAMDAIEPALGPQTMILPLLNGLCHLDVLAARFGHERLLGGLCQISAALDAQGAIEHFTPLHNLIFGELDGGTSPRVEALAAAFARARFDERLSPDIVQEMWEKWCTIASLAGMTCLMRATVGDIVVAGGAEIALQLFAECRAIAAHNGHAPQAQAIERTTAMITASGSPVTASMYKDILRGAPTEADHIVSELLRRGDPAQSYPLLRVVQAHLLAYEAQRKRLAG
ncbi:2-dehydropantoate 2-reductase [Uliginosibacterium paludis]|uniref:2-dehydropantoate 2-reductase n=1 Tax=Uliginosibacterium paludis TaxID=1615952 RepID=A0ABV2CMB2_9RHOO